MNTIHIYNARIEKFKIIYDYELEGEWEKYFNENNRLWIEYSEDISSIPPSIAVIPLLSNILPIVWLCDAKLYIDEIDLDFYESINQFKKGYTEMYPMLEFKGDMVINNIVDNKKEDVFLNNSGVFFSGGVDAFSTLFSHIEEHPSLITLWGADISLDDTEGWSVVQNHIKEVSDEYNIGNLFIKSNFRNFINEPKLNKLVAQSGDKWWHGFQCGVGLVGHSAPYAFKKNLYRVYIASSYTPDYKGTTASVPTTDGEVRFSKCEIFHDQYELNRQKKIENIVEYSKMNEKDINLRVCWKSTGGSNCCSCEKCYRTMMGLLAAKANPSEFGFSFDESVQNRMIYDLKYKVLLEETTTLPFWEDIQNSFKKNFDSELVSNGFEWFIRMDINNFNKHFFKITRLGFIKAKRNIKAIMFRV